MATFLQTVLRIWMERREPTRAYLVLKKLREVDPKLSAEALTYVKTILTLTLTYTHTHTHTLHAIIITISHVRCIQGVDTSWREE